MKSEFDTDRQQSNSESNFVNNPANNTERKLFFSHKFTYLKPESGDQTSLFRFLVFTLSLSAWTVTVLFTPTSLSPSYFFTGITVFYLALLMEIFPRVSLLIIQLTCILSTAIIVHMALSEIGDCYQGCSNYDISVGTPIQLIDSQATWVFISIYTLYSVSMMIGSFMAIYKSEDS